MTLMPRSHELSDSLQVLQGPTSQEPVGNHMTCHAGPHNVSKLVFGVRKGAL